MDKPEQVDLAGAVVLRRELLAEGYTDPQIRAKVKAGELVRVRHGSYCKGPLWGTLSPADRHRVLTRAVLKRAHPSTVATHQSSAVEQGVAVWGLSLDEVHVTRTDGKPSRREAGVVHHCGHLSDDEVTVVNGVRVTVPARSAVEVATTAGVEPALVVVNGMLHMRLISYDDFDAAVAATRHWPGSLATPIVQRLCDASLQSVAETRTFFLCWSQHLPRPETQVPITDESGWVFAYVDFAWRSAGVFVEFDGRIKYEKYRRDGETLEAYLMREKKREEKICQLTGWVCIRITWEDLAHPERTARRIRRMLESRRRDIGA